MKIKKLKLPPIPRYISGLKKDGSKDKRYKAGNTMAELEETIESISGIREIKKGIKK